MNVRLQYDLEFLGGIYFEDQLQMNQYSVSLNLVTGTADPADTNTAMDRVKAFVFGELEHSVFMNGAQRERAELMHMMGINVTTLPEEPVDQIIGMMLYYKLNAIMEGRMIVRSLDISSTLGDAVWYQHDDEDPPGPFTQDGWWHDCTVKHNTVDFAEADENVLKVEPNAWIDYGLLWPNEQPLNTTTTAGNTVVFGNFPKNEN
jgi:hypothetical protein